MGAARAMSVVVTPAWASAIAAVRPAAPPPTTTTSEFERFIAFSSCLHLNV
jgi:hypothetical protein